jgi:hypothetical protein
MQLGEYDSNELARRDHSTAFNTGKHSPLDAGAGGKIKCVTVRRETLEHHVRLMEHPNDHLSEDEKEAQRYQREPMEGLGQASAFRSTAPFPFLYLSRTKC